MNYKASLPRIYNLHIPGGENIKAHAVKVRLGEPKLFLQAQK